MTITIDNYKDILPTLKKLYSDDKIIFSVNGKNFKYNPCGDYLEGRGISNVKIFRVLGLNEYEFCAAVYGYMPLNGIFPVCHIDPDRNLIRITQALFDKCVEKSIPVKTLSLSTMELSILKDRKESIEPKPKFFKIDDLDMF